MQKSVENIRSETNIKKQVSITVKDEYCRLMGIMMNILSNDDDCEQVNYKQGVKRHGDKVVRVMFEECCQLGDIDKEAFIQLDASKLLKKQKGKSQSELLQNEYPIMSL